jgi:hypothetical protein
LEPLRRDDLLVADPGKPTEATRKIPVPVAEQLHRRRQEHATDQRRVDQNCGGESDPCLLEFEGREGSEERMDADSGLDALDRDRAVDLDADNRGASVGRDRRVVLKTSAAKRLSTSWMTGSGTGDRRAWMNASSCPGPQSWSSSMIV